MSVQVKICGIRTAAALDAALAAGVDYFGLVFYRPSPRYVEHEAARALIERARGRARSVALLVDPTDAEIETVAETVRPDLVQLHGRESPERVAWIKRRLGVPVVKAVPVGGAEDARKASDYAVADHILFDAKPPAGMRDPLPGGNGFAFDWGVLEGVARGDFILSGGLDADNVGQAIAATGAPIVDVSSGVERAPGDKDPELMRRFVAAAKARATAA